jgi:hypothetical protein
MKIKFGRDGQEIGEYPEEAVPALLQSRVLFPTDLFWHEGLPEWQSVSSRWPAAKEPPIIVATVNREIGALARCPACKKEVSVEAAGCPHCGHVLKRTQSATGVLAAVVIGFLLFFFLILPLIRSI